jgi:exodeoxyribonuclease X
MGDETPSGWCFMLLRCLDCETTGLNPAEDRVVEIGWCDVLIGDDGSAHVSESPDSTLVNPGIPIPCTASAIHHLVDADVTAAPILADAMPRFMRDDVFAYVAHRASFDREFLPAIARWICSWKVAVTLAPNAPSHSNQALRYFLKLAVDPALAMPAHRAGPDAYVTAHLVARALAKMSAEEMVRISARPVLLPRLPFGKHQGMAFAEVPFDYLEWVAANISDDENVQHTARAEIERRREARRSRSPV